MNFANYSEIHRECESGFSYYNTQTSRAARCIICISTHFVDIFVQLVTVKHITLEPAQLLQSKLHYVEFEILFTKPR